MASPSGNANPSGHLFKPAGSPNPIPAAAGGGAGISSPFPPPSSFPAPPPPAGAFSYPSSPAPPPFHHHPYFHYPQDPINRPSLPFPPSPHLPNHGARLMALLNPPPGTFETAVSMPPPPSNQWSEFLGPPSSSLLYPVPSAPTATLTQATSAPVRLPSNKLPRGRLLGGGDRAVYDVDSRFPGETQPPQLEVTPITKYISDPGLVLGRQIAVNRSYICYGLKLGAIRVLNINTALRSLLKGHPQRVTDMIFFAEDVHLLASASVDGRIFVWKIDEGPDEENKPQITGKIIIAIQIIDRELYHPRICWHSHKQEILFVGIGNHVLRIDTNKVGRGKEFSEEPLKFSMEKLIDGVQSIGKHEADVTDLSISQWMTTRLASASKDGTVKIWDERRVMVLSTLRPYDGSPVSMVSFMTSSHRPDHINLITAGPLNRELKIWASDSEEGWHSPSDSESWRCTQSLNLRSSLVPRIDEAFFNQIIVMAHASLIVIANAKKNAIYTVHVDYGSCPSSTRMDYIADFAVAMPVLSLTGAIDFLPVGEQVIKVYCVQTQAIQQYALDLIQCLPPQIANAGNGRDPSFCISEIPSYAGSDLLDPSSASSLNQFPSGVASPKTQHTDCIKTTLTTSHPITSTPHVNNIHEFSAFDIVAKPTAPSFQNVEAKALQVVPSAPLNLDIVEGLTTLNPQNSSEKALSLCDHDAEQSVLDYTLDKEADSVVKSSPNFPAISKSKGKNDGNANQNDVSMVPNPRLMSKLGGNLTHLITPSEILSGAIASSESFCDNKWQTDEEVKIQDSNNDSTENVEFEVKVVGEGDPNDIKEWSSRALEGDLQLENECSTDTPSVKELAAGIVVPESIDQVSPVEDVTRERCDKMPESVDAAALQSFAAVKGKLKGKQYQNSIHSSKPSISAGSLNEPGSSMVAPSFDAALPHILSMQETLNQLMGMQRDMQKQMSVIVGAPVTKEGSRLETTLVQHMENTVKVNMDALWARFQEENAKREMVEKERIQQITMTITNCISKDLPAMIEKVLKKEISSVGSVVARAISPLISSTITESFQRGVGDKAVNQLEKSIISKLEAAVARQIQTQFQTSGKQALNDALRSCLESTVVPAFEQSCKVMFEQMETALQKGMSEHRAAAQQQVETAHGPLALTLKDAIHSASSITQSVTTELIDGQRKLLALVAAGNTTISNPVGLQQANGSIGRIAEMLAASVQQVEAPLDPMKELSRLITEHKFEEAFTIALQRSDVAVVSWLCAQVDLHAICSTVPLPLSQGVLLALLQQLACDVNNKTTSKLSWIRDVAVAINPTDPMITLHVRPIFEQVYNILAHQRSSPTIKPSESTSIQLIMHVLNSVLMSCK